MHAALKIEHKMPVFVNQIIYILLQKDHHCNYIKFSFENKKVGDFTFFQN